MWTSYDVFPHQFDVELVSPLDGGCVSDFTLAVSYSLCTASCSVNSDTSSHSKDWVNFSGESFILEYIHMDF